VGKFGIGQIGDYMDRRLLTVAAVTAILVARTAAADAAVNFFETGNSLLAQCQSANNSYDRAYCDGYSAGVIDTLSTLKMICPPVGATDQQVSDIIVNYLVAHPEWRHYTAPSLAQQALLAIWPCR
jgi:Rap1a immunity proteins